MKPGEYVVIGLVVLIFGALFSLGLAAGVGTGWGIALGILTAVVAGTLLFIGVVGAAVRASRR